MMDADRGLALSDRQPRSFPQAKTRHAELTGRESFSDPFSGNVALVRMQTRIDSNRILIKYISLKTRVSETGVWLAKLKDIYNLKR